MTNQENSLVALITECKEETKQFENKMRKIAREWGAKNAKNYTSQKEMHKAIDEAIDETTKMSKDVITCGEIWDNIVCDIHDVILISASVVGHKEN